MPTKTQRTTNGNNGNEPPDRVARVAKAALRNRASNTEARPRGLFAR